MVRCGCGRKMSTRTAKVGGRLYHYYVCNRPAVEKRAGRCAQRCIRAVNFEDMVWRFVSDLLKHPDRIRVGIDKLVERERTGGSVDTEREALYWAEKVEECSHLRSAFQDQQAAGLMTLEELGSKLKKLEQTRQVAEAEIAVLSAREERARQLEADRDSLVASYAATVPEALDSLAGEERSRVYRMLNLEVKPEAEGHEVSGALCNSQPTGRYRLECSSGSLACGPCTFGDRARSEGGRR
jgi:Recombinase zinc beta ribbon domain